MGPRPVGRGNSGNGIEWVIVGGASMGPRPVGRGNDVQGYTNDYFMGCFNGATSCRTWKLIASLIHLGVTALASMGPRPVGRGNSVMTQSLQDEPFLLQWGHVLSDVEMAPICAP